MTIEIVHRYTRAVLYRSESVADLKAAVIEAVAKRANLGGADLVGADLVGANLGGAYLGGANLGGAEIAAGEIASVVGTGHLLGYTWTAYAMKDGTLLLRYGCEEHTIPEWRERNKALAERHARAEKSRYMGALTALFALVETAAGSAK